MDAPTETRDNPIKQRETPTTRFRLLRWMGRNLGSLIMAFLLALMVWVSAVVNDDPNEECTAPRFVEVEVVGLSPHLKVIGGLPNAVEVLLRAPHSLCEKMDEESDSVRAAIDLSALGEGQHDVSVDVQIGDEYRPVRMLNTSPTTATVSLEALLVKEFPIRIEILGEQAPGFTVGFTSVNATRVEIAGLKSVVNAVVDAVVYLDITDAEDNVIGDMKVILLDAEGEQVGGLTSSPAFVGVVQEVGRPGNFRDVTVKLKTIGQQEEGYQLTNIVISPQWVTLFSSDEQTLRDMPGFIETIPLDLTGSTDDIERRLSLVLPDGISVFGGEQTVVVQVGIAAIEISKPLFALPVEVIGYAENLEVTLSLNIVDVIVSGPGSILDLLQPTDVRVVLDLTGMQPGDYTVEPRIEIVPLGVRVESILPPSIDVSLAIPPTPTATPTLTPTPTMTPTPGPSPTPSPTGTGG